MNNVHGWFSDNKEWIEFIAAAVVLWLLMMTTISVFDLRSAGYDHSIINQSRVVRGGFASRIGGNHAHVVDRRSLVKSLVKKPPNLANNLVASACVNLFPIIAFGTATCDQARGVRPPCVATWPPQIRTTSAPFPEWYLRKSEPGGSDATDHL